MESDRVSQPWRAGDELEAVRLEQMRHNAESAQLYAGSPNVRFYGSAQGGRALVVDEPEVPTLPGFFPVTVEKDGGSNGTASTTASYTYTVRALDGTTVLGTAVAQSRPRDVGEVTFQSGATGYGSAFYDGGTLRLWDAGEVPANEECA